MSLCRGTCATTSGRLFAESRARGEQWRRELEPRSRIAIVSEYGERRSTAWCATIETDASWCAPQGHDVEVFGTGRFRTAMPEIKGDPPCRVLPRPRARYMWKVLSRPSDQSRERGGRWAGGPRLLPRAPFTSRRPITRAFPNMCAARIRWTLSWSYAFVRRFHAPSAA